MPKPPRPWIVSRHDPIEEIDENLWAVNGDIPGFPPAARFHRRMHIVKRSDGRLLFNNAIPLDDAALGKVEAWGQPAMVVVPHHLHAIDAHAFAERLGLDVYTSGKENNLLRGGPLAIKGTVDELPEDEAHTVEQIASSKFGEVAIAVKSGPRVSLLLCDAVLNLRHGGGFAGFLFKVLGFTGDQPKVAPLTRLRAFPDKALLKKDLLRLADLPGLHRVVPSHGLSITEDPAGVLHRIAQSL